MWFQHWDSSPRFEINCGRLICFNFLIHVLSSQIEKILQQGDISDASEPYLKGKDLDRKSLDKYKSNADFFCQQLRKYRMPFAWTAIGVLDILAGNQV